MTRVRSTTARPRTASRKDLLVVGSDLPMVAADPETVLIGLGYRVKRKHLQHWVLTGEQPLPELHFYSKMELGRFVMDRAGHYLNPRQGSTYYADVADLPG